MSRNIERALDRVERELKDARCEMRQAESRMNRFEPDSYEYSLADNEYRKLCRKVEALETEQVALEEELEELYV